MILMGLVEVIYTGCDNTSVNTTDMIIEDCRQYLHKNRVRRSNDAYLFRTHYDHK